MVQSRWTLGIGGKNAPLEKRDGASTFPKVTTVAPTSACRKRDCIDLQYQSQQKNGFLDSFSQTEVHTSAGSKDIGKLENSVRIAEVRLSSRINGCGRGGQQLQATKRSYLELGNKNHAIHLNSFMRYGLLTGAP